MFIFDYFTDLFIFGAKAFTLLDHIHYKSLVGLINYKTNWHEIYVYTQTLSLSLSLYLCILINLCQSAVNINDLFFSH